MKTIKTSSKAVIEFNFYLNSPLDMIGHSIGAIFAFKEDLTNGYSALECWYAKDTHGIILPCKEIDILSKVERSKQSVNLQIKLWAEDIADGILLRQEELLNYTHNWPEWVFKAAIAQAGKLCLNNPRIGYIPRFARIEYVYDNIWLPENDYLTWEI